MEIADTSHKDNYNKVVIQKRKCVPCTAETVITLTEDVGDDVGARLKYVLNNNNKIIRYTSLFTIIEVHCCQEQLTTCNFAALFHIFPMSVEIPGEKYQRMDKYFTLDFVTQEATGIGIDAQMIVPQQIIG